MAYAVAPGPGGAEAEVNSSLLLALADYWPAPVVAICGAHPSAIRASALGRAANLTVHALGECGEHAASPTTASRVASWCLAGLRRDPSTPLVPRLVNGLTFRLSGQGVKGAWTAAAARTLDRVLRQHPDAVVYSRALPLASIEAAAPLQQRRGFPWIVNINDPMPVRLWPGQYAVDARADRRTDDTLRHVLPQVAAFTFPSSGLQQIEQEAYPGMARVPCAVLPHVAPPVATEDAAVASAPDSPLRIVFLGTLRANRLDPAFVEGIRRWLDASNDRRVHLSFLIPTAGPHVRRMQDLLGQAADVRVGEPETRIADAARDADVLLDLESAIDAPLLIAKLARYAASHRPIWAVCDPRSTTWELVARLHGGYLTPLGDAPAVAATLASIHHDWQSGLLARRAVNSTLPDHFAGSRIVPALAELCATVRARRTAPASHVERVVPAHGI
jgi:hypothetical protein